MKKLIINNEVVVIDADQYFPFTYKLSDLEEINIINFPSTKSVILPRNTQNDNIFGHIAEITRVNTYGEDNKVGISFNQFKKGTYELLNGSETVSKGIIRIVNITEEGYEIELYDQAIELLETFEDKNIEDLIIINPQTGLPLSVMVNYATVADMLKKDYGVTPIFGDYDTNFETNELMGRTSIEIGSNLTKLTLPETLTPLQLRTFPAGDMPYAIRLLRVFDMIQNSVDAEVRNKVAFSPTVRALVENVYMLLKKPKNGLVTETTELAPNSAVDATDMGGGRFSHPNMMSLVVPGKGFYLIRNGNYQLRNEFEVTITTKTAHTNGIIMTYRGRNYTTNEADLTDLGNMYVDTLYQYDSEYGQSPIETKIPLIYGTNTTYKKVGNKGQLTIKGAFVINRNHYPMSAGVALFVTNQFRNYGSLKWPATMFTTVAPFGLSNSNYTVASTVTPTITHKPLDFTEYDTLTSEKLMPDMSIKDFIIDLAKTYNFNITAGDNGLYVDVKRYRETDEIILIDGQPDIDVSKVDFSKLIISSESTDSEHIKEYEEKLGKKWASKTINTGYTIKKEVKEVEMPYGTSLPIIDYNYFAYNAFGEYLNGGYAKVATGDIRGLDGGLILGYMHKNTDDIYITDTRRLNDKSILSNERLTYMEGKWRFNDEISAAGIKLETYPTFMPYRFVEDEIVESMEFNKPEYNFADVIDKQYPDSATMYNRFHRNMLVDKYDANTHILTAQLFIEGVADIGNIYNYKNSNYIIAELVEYDPTEPGLYEVKLMRVNDIKNYTTLPPLPETGVDPELPTVSVVSVPSISPITVAWGTEPRFLDLPKEIVVQLTSGSLLCKVGWMYVSPYYDPYTSGPYTWRGRLELPPGVINPLGLEASITVTVAKEEGAGPKYNNKFAYVVEAFFEGDLRTNESLGGFNSKVKVGVDNEPYITRLDHSLIYPNLTYANGETKSVFTGEIDLVWQTTKLYKVFTEQAIRYQKDGRNAEYDLGDTSIVNFNGLTNGSGTILERNTPQVIQTETVTNYLTTPIRLDELRKTLLFNGSDYYEITVQMGLTNNTSELHNADVRVQGFTVTGPEGTKYISGSDFTSISTSTSNKSGGIQVLINIRVPSNGLMGNFNVEDFEVIMDKGITIKPAGTPSYVSIGAETQNSVTAVTRFAFFPYENLRNITGNEKSTVGSSIKLLRWKVTYTNTASLI